MTSIKQMQLKDRISWAFGSYLIREHDNPYSYTCRRCGQYFITIGEFDFPYHNEIVPPDPSNLIDPKCKCVKTFKREYWAN